MTADKYFYIVDRLKFIFKNKGYQVSPAELEAHLLSLELVDDVGVVGRPSERFGEVPVAFVVLSSLGRDRDPSEVKDAIKFSVQRAKVC
ncbi:4-coumarate:CoA ligase, partial [Mycena alexandri]